MKKNIRMYYATCYSLGAPACYGLPYPCPFQFHHQLIRGPIRNIRGNKANPKRPPPNIIKLTGGAPKRLFPNPQF